MECVDPHADEILHGSHELIDKPTDLDGLSIPSSIDSSVIISAFSESHHRMLLLDYDGTLSPLQKLPKEAAPSEKLKTLLRNLVEKACAQVYVMSGRDRTTLDEWLGELPIGFCAEHGAFFKPCPRFPGEKTEWQSSTHVDTSWKKDVLSIFRSFTERTPGSMLEEKELDVTWHYRNSDPVFGESQKNHLLLHLQNLPNFPIDILCGKKCVEVRPMGVNKGLAVRRALEDSHCQFVIAIGDDKTDESMYEELGRYAPTIKYCFSINVQQRPSLARFYVERQSDVINLLQQFSSIPQPPIPPTHSSRPRNH